MNDEHLGDPVSPSSRASIILPKRPQAVHWWLQLLPLPCLGRTPNHQTVTAAGWRGAFPRPATLCRCAPPTLPTMCSSVTMAMKPRLPMMTTCCRGRAAGNSRGVSVACSPSPSQWQGAGSHVHALERAETHGCDLDAGGVVCVEAHHAVLQPAASLSAPGCKGWVAREQRHQTRGCQDRGRRYTARQLADCDDGLPLPHLASCARPGLQLRVFLSQTAHPWLPGHWLGLQMRPLPLCCFCCWGGWLVGQAGKLLQKKRTERERDRRGEHNQQRLGTQSTQWAGGHRQFQPPLSVISTFFELKLVFAGQVSLVCKC